MNIVLNELTEFNSAVFHNIQGVPLDFDEFDDLTNDPKAKKYAHRISDADEIDLHPNELQYHAIDFIFKQTSWLLSRFGNGAYPVWYGAVNLETSFHETIYHWRRTYLEAPQGFNQFTEQPVITQRTVFTVACRAALIDLRSKVKEHIELVDPDPSHYPQTQALGLRIHQEGYPGVVNQSARIIKSENVAVFKKEILSAPAHEHDYQYEYDLLNHKVSVKRVDSGKVVLVV